MSLSLQSKLVIALGVTCALMIVVSNSHSQISDLFSDSEPTGARRTTHRAQARVRSPQPASADDQWISQQQVPTRVRQCARMVVEKVQEQIPAEELKRGRQLVELRAKLRSAKDEGARTSLAAQYKSLVAAIFDEDLARREGELKRVEARVQRLRNALEKRKAARTRIIDLQVNTVVLEAEGLSFPAVFPPSDRRHQATLPGFRWQNTVPDDSDLPLGADDLFPTDSVPASDTVPLDSPDESGDLFDTSESLDADDSTDGLFEDDLLDDPLDSDAAEPDTSESLDDLFG